MIWATFKCDTPYKIYSNFIIHRIQIKIKYYVKEDKGLQDTENQ